MNHSQSPEDALADAAWAWTETHTAHDAAGWGAHITGGAASRPPVPFASDSTYRVKGGAWLAEPHACDLDGNGFRVTADGTDALLSGAALEYLSGSRGENDDGYIEDGLIWAVGDAHEIVLA